MVRLTFTEILILVEVIHDFGNVPSAIIHHFMCSVFVFARFSLMLGRIDSSSFSSSTSYFLRRGRYAYLRYSTGAFFFYFSWIFTTRLANNSADIFSVRNTVHSTCARKCISNTKLSMPAGVK